MINKGYLYKHGLLEFCICLSCVTETIFCLSVFLVIVFPIHWHGLSNNHVLSGFVFKYNFVDFIKFYIFIFQLLFIVDLHFNYAIVVFWVKVNQFNIALDLWDTIKIDSDIGWRLSEWSLNKYLLHVFFFLSLWH